jgi:hypothetical protein
MNGITSLTGILSREAIDSDGGVEPIVRYSGKQD